jgi:transposase-like protein
MVQVNIKKLIDDVQCYQTVRELRWPDGIECPSCESKQVIKRGFDDTEGARQRYECTDCHKRFDDLTDTIFAGHHQPLKVWILCLYFMGLNLSNEQIAQELAVNGSDVYQMTTQLRDGIVIISPLSCCPPKLSATKPMWLPAIKGILRWSSARDEKDVDADSKAKVAVAHWRRKDRPSLG